MTEGRSSQEPGARSQNKDPVFSSVFLCELTGLKINAFGALLSRGHIPGTKLHPGTGRRRVFSRDDALKFALTRELFTYGIDHRIGFEIAATLFHWRRRDGKILDWWAAIQKGERLPQGVLSREGVLSGEFRCARFYGYTLVFSPSPVEAAVGEAVLLIHLNSFVDRLCRAIAELQVASRAAGEGHS